MKNQFKHPENYRRTSTEVIASTIGRPAHEHLKRNPPVFEDAVIETRRTGIKWLFTISK